MTLTKSQKARRAQAQQQKRNNQPRGTAPSQQKAKPKQKKKPSRTSSSRRVDYFQHLMNPEVHHGVRIPDDTSMVPTGTYHIKQSFTLTAVGGSGRYAAGVQLHLLNNFKYSILTGYDGGNGITDTSYTLAGFSQFNAIYDTYRLVSACIILEFTGNSQYDQGVATAWQTYDSYSPANVSEIQNLAGATSYPARSRSIKVCFRPRDNIDYEFVPIGESSDRQHIGIWCVGVDQSFSANVTFHLNLEGLPKSSYGNAVSTVAIPHKPEEMSRAHNLLSQIGTFVAPAILSTAATTVLKSAMSRRSRVEPYVYEL